MPTAEVNAPEVPVNPPVAPAVVENPVQSVTPSLEDSQKIKADEQELVGILNHTEVKPVDQVVHEGETILAHTFRIDGDNILLPGESAQDFKADLDAPPEEKRHWFAVFALKVAKFLHKVITFGKTSQA